MAESRNLTTSKVDRQNILNNSLAVTEIEKHTTNGCLMADPLDERLPGLILLSVDFCDYL